MIFVQQYLTTLFTCQATIIFTFYHRKRSFDYICTASVVNKICLHQLHYIFQKNTIYIKLPYYWVLLLFLSNYCFFFQAISYIWEGLLQQNL